MIDNGEKKPIRIIPVPLQEPILIKGPSRPFVRIIRQLAPSIDIRVLEGDDHSTKPVVTVIKPDKQPVVTVIENQLSETISDEVNVRLAILGQENQDSAVKFFQILRQRTPDFFPESVTGGRDYTHAWYSNMELKYLADRWHIPALFVRVGTNHWCLALRSPEVNPQTGLCRVLIYNPTQGGENWHDLPQWKPARPVRTNVLSEMVASEIALTQLEAGIYDLTLFGDDEFAKYADILRAKGVRTQFDAENCGPACLFMAALREGCKPKWTAFNFSGRKKLTQDTGLKVLTRDELLTSSF